jgi:hypothetical protein
VKLSPEMKHAENFLFSISGGTCSRNIADLGSYLYIVSLYSSVLSLAINKVFSALNNCVLYL